MFSRREWFKTLKSGDKVITKYRTDAKMQESFRSDKPSSPRIREVTVDYVIDNALSQSGILVKLKEFPEPLDLSWINPIIETENQQDSNLFDAITGGYEEDIVIFLESLDLTKGYLIINNAHLLTTLASITLCNYLEDFEGSVQINGETNKIYPPLRDLNHR